MSTDKEKESVIFKNLLKWLTDQGGYVHPSITIFTSEDSSYRGVKTLTAIKKGELLCKIPDTAVINGSSVGQKYYVNIDDGDSKSKKRREVMCSEWLRCMIALIQADLQSVNENLNEPSFKPYLDSLPLKYDTLVYWPDNELDYLKGTTLYRHLIAESNSNKSERISTSGDESKYNRAALQMKKRYESHVLPALCHFLGSDIENRLSFDRFLHHSQCLSTRGFHEQDITTNDGASSGYNGPSLIPFIDLLNHSDFKFRDGKSSVGTICTVSTRDPRDGSRFMEAIRDMEEGEELLQSYGDEKNSFQLLQTFGFIPLNRAEVNIDITKMGSSDNVKKPNSPLLLDRELLYECARCVMECFKSERNLLVAESLVRNFSGLPPIQNNIEACTGPTVGVDENEEDAFLIWNPAVCVERKLAFLNSDKSFLQEHMVLDLELSTYDEFVTACAVLFLPEEAFDDYLKDPSVLEGEMVIEDKFLALCIIRTVHELLKVKGVSTKQLNDLKLLPDLVSINEIKSKRRDGENEQNSRELNALIIRVEEMLNLFVLERHLMEGCFLKGNDCKLEKSRNRLDCLFTSS